MDPESLFFGSSPCVLLVIIYLLESTTHPKVSLVSGLLQQSGHSSLWSELYKLQGELSLPSLTPVYNGEQRQDFQNNISLWNGKNAITGPDNGDISFSVHDKDSLMWRWKKVPGWTLHLLSGMNYLSVYHFPWLSLEHSPLPVIIYCHI